MFIHSALVGIGISNYLFALTPIHPRPGVRSIRHRFTQGATARARAVKLLDGTTVSMPDTADNQATYPQSGAQHPGLGFPIAMLEALISLSTGTVLRWATGPCRGKGTGEQALFRALMPDVAAGDITLVDCYHCTYFTLAMLQKHGADIVTKQHQRRITDFRRGAARVSAITWSAGSVRHGLCG
jgi:hypothetical protein